MSLIMTIYQEEIQVMKMNEEPKEILEEIVSLKSFECCDEPPLVRIDVDKNGDYSYDIWDFCPSCLE